MSAQLEDGFARIANEILEGIAKSKLNGSQFRILIAVWRHTYGFNRKDAEMSLSYLEGATEMAKSQIDRELKTLIKSKVLVVTKEASFTQPRKIGFNKLFAEWELDSQQKRGQSANQSTVSQNADIQSANPSTGTVSQLADQEIHSFKDIITTTAGSGSEVEQHFVKRRAKGTMVGHDDHKAIVELLDYGIPASFINEVVDKTFSEFKPKYPRHTITNFTYCVPRIYEEWHNKQERSKPYEPKTSVRQGSPSSHAKPSEVQSGVLPSKYVKYDEHGNLLQVSGLQG